MTTIYNLRAATNVTFKLTRNFSNIAQVYNIAASTIRMQARVTALSNDPPIYEWCSSNVSGGLASFDPTTGLCVFSAPASDMAQMPARLVYDCRLELTGGSIAPLFCGRMTFTQGVTRSALDAAANGESPVGDTVIVDGETSSTPAVLPVTITAVLSAAQAAGVAAATSAAAAASSAQASASGAASLTPSALAASFAALSPSQAAALAQLLFAALPDMSSGSVPVVSGQAFVDASGFFVRAV